MSSLNILTTDPKLMKIGGRSMELGMLDLINDSGDEIQILSYSITHGAERIMKALENALDRGVKLTFILNKEESVDHDIMMSLRNFSKVYRHAKIYTFSRTDRMDLHAKLLISDRSRAVIGSANLTSRGLLWNLEIGFMIEDDTIWKLSEMVDSIESDSEIIPK